MYLIRKCYEQSIQYYFEWNGLGMKLSRLCSPHCMCILCSIVLVAQYIITGQTQFFMKYSINSTNY